RYPFGTWFVAHEKSRSSNAVDKARGYRHAADPRRLSGCVFARHDPITRSLLLSNYLRKQILVAQN
ncbi:hypothetical protein LAJ55_14260, partial [Streptococcus pneumoniae]|uniref:hypothetical protein n=1 Tax=Streptococcus pneumoniae TaxID=1313 RepID=UPI001CBAA652